MTHTDEPWKWAWRNDEDAPGSIYSEKLPGHHYAVAMCPRYGKENFEKDTPRIVTCVNALAGIPNEQIERDAKLYAHVDEMRKLYDAAARVLKAHDLVIGAKDRDEALIAKCEKNIELGFLLSLVDELAPKLEESR